MFGLPIGGYLLGLGNLALGAAFVAGVVGIAWFYFNDKVARERLTREGVSTIVTFVGEEEWGDGNISLIYEYETMLGRQRGSVSPGYVPWRNSPAGVRPGDSVQAVYDPTHPGLVGWLGDRPVADEPTQPTTLRSTAAEIVLVAAGIAMAVPLAILVKNGFDRPDSFSSASPVLFVAICITSIAALPAMNGLSWQGGKPGPIDHFAVVVMVESWLAFALLTLSPWNH
jgi:hypothetical protein